MPQPFTAASHHDVLVLLVQLAVLLLSARLLGEIAQRLGQPSVVGEILAGVVLGPSLISGLVPFLGEWLVPQTEVQGYLLEVVSLLGAMFLLLITGLETDLVLIRQQARSAVGVAVGGLVLPLLVGFLLGWWLPDDLLVDPSSRIVFALFIATAMAISAIPVVAKVLMELKLTRRDVGQTIIASAMIDDAMGWILLSVVIGLASGAAITVGAVLQSVVSVVGFILVGFTLGRWLIGKSVHLIQNHAISAEKMLSLVLVWVLIAGVVTQALGLEALLGAFVVGAVFAQISSLSSDVLHKIESITFGIFAPIFFAVAGLKVNIIGLLEPRLLLLLLLVIGLATVCKVLGVYVGSRWIGRRDHWSALFFGFGLNARGSMGIIVATIGLNLGVLSQTIFSVIVVMALVTSLITPFALRLLLPRIEMTGDERERLEREARTRDNVIANVRRILLPVRPREDLSPIQTAEARILERICNGNNPALTLLTVSSKGEEALATEYLNQTEKLFPGYTLTKKLVTGDQPAELILNETKMAYDLLILGAPQKAQDTRVLFTPITDYLARLVSSPLLIVHAPDIPPDWQPRRMIVPTNGSLAAKRAVEMGFALAVGDSEAEVLILKIVAAEQSAQAVDNERMVQQQVNISQQIVAELRAIGKSFGVKTRARVKVAKRPGNAILEVARRQKSDLIVLGVSVRAGSERLYLGPMVEYILENVPCPVVVFNAAQG